MGGMSVKTAKGRIATAPGQGKYVGIDGCRGGWFAVQLDDNGSWKTALVKRSDRLASLIAQSTQTLIDIPIGLLDDGGPHRQCDHEARKALGIPRAASVFPTPSRPAVYAGSYEQSCQLNTECLGRKLSKQSWNIAAKIKQVDILLHENIDLRGKLRECHPEICFWALNHKQAMRFNKKRSSGRTERLAVLKRYLSEAEKILAWTMTNYARSEVAQDDIIDAMVIAVTARQGSKDLRGFPVNPTRDRLGLVMEITYSAPYIAP